MPRITETFTVAMPIEAAFAYLADFTNTEEWDPGVRAAEQVRGTGAGKGALVRVDFAVGPTSVPLTYETTRHDEPTAVTFTTEGRFVRGEDRITLSTSGDSTTIEWDARFGFASPLSVADPLLAPGFQRVAGKAVASLRERLEELAAEHGASSATA